MNVTVAGVRLAFLPPPGLHIVAPGFQYPPFLAATAGRRQVTVQVTRDGRALPTAGDTLFDTGDGWRLRQCDGLRVLEMPDRRGGPALWRVAWRLPLREAVAWVGPAMVHGQAIRHLVQYPLDQILLCEALREDGMLLLHAAGGDGPDGGFVFAGVSGAGKSTISRQLEGVDRYRLLSDDRLVAGSPEGPPRIHGTPWSGDAGIARPASTMLSALCFLRQSAAPALRALAPRIALERLLPVATLPWYHRDEVQAALARCEALVTAVPCFELAFNRDAGATGRVLEALRHAA